MTFFRFGARSALISLTAVLFLGVMAFLASALVKPQQAQAAGEIVLAQHSEGERTCCRRQERGGYRIFWSTFGECYRLRGDLATNKTCRDHGGFHATGAPVWGSGWQQGSWNDRVCCSRRGQVWWSTRGDCYRNKGVLATNKTCRRN